MPPLPIVLLVAAVVAVALAILVVQARRRRREEAATHAATEAAVAQLTEDDIAWRIGAVDRPSAHAAELAARAADAAEAAALFAAAAAAAAEAFANAEHEAATAAERETGVQAPAMLDASHAGDLPVALSAAAGEDEGEPGPGDEAEAEPLPIAAAVASAPVTAPPGRAPTAARELPISSRYLLWRDSAAVLLVACLVVLAVLTFGPGMLGGPSTTPQPTQLAVVDSPAPMPGDTATISPTAAPSPTQAPTPAADPAPTLSPRPSPSRSPAPSPSPSSRPTPKPTPKPTPVATPRPQPTPTPTPKPTATPAPTLSPLVAAISHACLSATSASFSTPKVTGATYSWTFSNGQTSSSRTPTMDFGSTPQPWNVLLQVTRSGVTKKDATSITCT